MRERHEEEIDPIERILRRLQAPPMQLGTQWADVRVGSHVAIVPKLFGDDVQGLRFSVPLYARGRYLQVGSNKL